MLLTLIVVGYDAKNDLTSGLKKNFV